MPIHIKNIQINNLGPINNANFDLGLVNLFYGQNESGKTYLTEFILSSLFQHAKKWQLRDLPNAGSVTITGMEDDPITLSPSSSRKIEDYWSQSQPGLPVNMARLLVVKGSEVSLTKTAPGGVGRKVLKDALTSQRILDSIRKSIPATAQNAELIGNQIIGKNQGIIKEKNNLAQELTEISDLLSKIENEYQGGAIKGLEIRRKKIQDELSLQEKAKQHHAYLLWTQHQKLLSEREDISDQVLFSLRDQVRDYQKNAEKLAELKKKINDIKPDVDAYHWLSRAIQIWESQNLERYQLPSLTLLISGGLLLLSGLGLLITQFLISRPDYFWPGIIGILLGVGLAAYNGLKYFQWSNAPAESEERKMIQTSFQDRFGRELKGLTDLHHQLGLVEKKYHQSGLIKEERAQLEAQLNPAEGNINSIFSNLAGSTFSEQIWDQQIKELFAKAKELDKESQDLLIEFTKLNIPQNHFQTTPPETTYSPDRITNLTKSLEAVNARIAEQESELESLKIKACGFTKDKLSKPWTEVLSHLRTKKQEILTDHRLLIAELTAMIGLSAILDNLDSEVDQKIVAAINQEEVSSLLHRLTGKYQKIKLAGDELIIASESAEFALRDLSTGAKDQVALALRLGMANQISGGQSLFLILDDAFQHSDWSRRKKLVEEAAAIASQGWQIIYLTMDDHIRDLFQKDVKPAFKKHYRYFEMI